MMEGIDQVWAGRIRPQWTVKVTSDDRPDRQASLAGLDDRGLVAACRAGHREAFDVIVERHRRAVYRLCYRFVGNHEDASDLAQEVFLRAYRALTSFKGDSSLGTWLYRIGVNVSLSRVSARKPPAEPIEVRDQVPDRGDDPATALLRSERSARVRAAITRLPRKQRVALILRVYHELPHQEIAKIVGGSVGAVKANFFHALKNLRKLLADEPT